MSFRRDLEDLGLLKLVLDTNRSTQILEEMRESQLETVRRQQYAASLESKDKLAEEIEAITDKIEKIKSQLSAVQPCSEELEQTMVSSSEPLLFLLNNDKSERLGSYYRICGELLDGEELEEARRHVLTELKTSVFESVAILPHVFPKEGLPAQNAQISATWSKSLVELGWSCLLLLRVISSPEEAKEILEKLKIVEGFAIGVPVVKYPMSHLKSICDYMAGSDLPEIKIYPVNPGDKAVFDYKNIVKTQLVAVPECSIQVVAGLIAFIHLSCKQKQPPDLETYWAELQSRMRKLPIRIVNPGAHLSPFASDNAGGLIVGETDLQTYLKTHNLIGWRRSGFVWILLLPFIALKKRPVFASIIFTFLGICAYTFVNVVYILIFGK